MTTVVQQDHPDWMRSYASTVIELVTSSGNQGALQVDHGTIAAGNFPFIWIRLSVSAGGCRLGLSWEDAPSAGNVIAENFVDVLPGQEALGPFAVMGPYVNITTTVDVIGRFVFMQAWLASGEGQAQIANFHNSLISEDGANVNAGATRISLATGTRWGWGYWNAFLEGAATGRLRLLAINYLGVARVLGYWPNGFGPVATPIVLPPQPLRLETLNLDAAAHPVFAALTSHPGPV